MIATVAAHRAVLVALTALALLHDGPTVADTAKPPASTKAALPAAAITRGRVQLALTTFRAYAKTVHQRSGVPGIAIAVVQGDEVLLQDAMGLRDVEADLPVTPDTVFQLASTSKPFASATVASLVADGVLSWDDRIGDHLAGFRLKDDFANTATLRDAFAQRTGLPSHAGETLELLFGYDRSEILQRLRYLDQEKSFRSGFTYLDYMIVAAAEAASRAAGEPYEDLVQRHIFDRLGMTTAAIRFATFDSRENKATTYAIDPEGAWRPAPHRRTDAQAAAGGVSASLNDITRWLMFQVNGGRVDGRQVVPADALSETHARHTIIGHDHGERTYYALGWKVVDRSGYSVITHDGAFASGVSTIVTLMPEARLGLAVLTNGAPVGVVETLSRKFYDLVTGVDDGRDLWPEIHAAVVAAGDAADTATPGPPAEPRPALPAAAYLGRYENVYYGPVEVVAGNDGLVLRLGRSALVRPLTPWSGDIFVDSTIGRFVTFTIGPDGTASHVRIDGIDRYGSGLFERS